MSDKENNKRQRELIREFDKELFSYTGTVAWFLPGMFSFFMIMLVVIPFQELTNDDTIVIFMEFILSIETAQFVLLPYIRVTDSFTRVQNKDKTYNKLKYLPVSKRQYILVRMKYLFNYFWKLTVIGLVIQTITSVLNKSMGIENILYIVGLLFVAPMFAGWLDTLFE